MKSDQHPSLAHAKHRHKSARRTAERQDGTKLAQLMSEGFCLTGVKLQHFRKSSNARAVASKVVTSGGKWQTQFWIATLSTTFLKASFKVNRRFLRSFLTTSWSWNHSLRTAWCTCKLINIWIISHLSRLSLRVIYTPPGAVTMSYIILNAYKFKPSHCCQSTER